MEKSTIYLDSANLNAQNGVDDLDSASGQYISSIGQDSASAPAAPLPAPVPTPEEVPPERGAGQRKRPRRASPSPCPYT